MIHCLAALLLVLRLLVLLLLLLLLLPGWLAGCRLSVSLSGLPVPSVWSVCLCPSVRPSDWLAGCFSLSELRRLLL